MKVGFAEAVITPKDGRCLLAGYSPMWSTGVHDDLYASAVCFEDEGTKAVLISFDLLGMDANLRSSLKDRIQSSVSVDKERIFFTCTHTHEGPQLKVYSAEDEPPDYLEEYQDFLALKAAEVAREAESRLQECDVIVNRAYVDENMNRRFFLSDERNLYVPNYKELVPITNQFEDKELGLLYFCPKGSRHPFGVILNYTMHPLTAGNTSSLISADVPGVVRDIIKENMECLTCYINGAAGDNHPKAPEGGFAETRRVGQVLATEATKRRYDAFAIEEPIRLQGITRSVTLTLRSAEELRAIPPHAWEDRLDGLLKSLERPGEPIDVEFSLLGIGPILLIGVPGELVAELGAALKWFSPFKRTYIMYEATASMGYIAHPNAHKWGGYEAITGRFSPYSIRTLFNAIIDAAEEMASYVD